MQGIENAIRDGIGPVDWERDQRWMYVCPAFECQQEMLCLDTMVEHLHIIKLLCVFQLDLRMSFQFLPDTIYRGRIPLFSQYERFSLQISDGQARFCCQGMIGWYGDAVPVHANRKEMAAVEPLFGVAGGNQEIEFFPQRRNLG